MYWRELGKIREVNIVDVETKARSGRKVVR